MPQNSVDSIIQLHIGFFYFGRQYHSVVQIEDNESLRKDDMVNSIKKSQLDFKRASANDVVCYRFESGHK